MYPRLSGTQPVTRIGYACLNEDVPGAIFRTCRAADASPERLRPLIAANLAALDAIMDYNIRHGISMFRITSDLIPFGSSPVNTVPWRQEFSTEFEALASKIEKHGIRISMHPGQYTVLNSPKDVVVENAIRDLEYHADVLEALGGTRKNKLILHIGGAYGDKPAAMERFIAVYQGRLSQRIKNHLVIENDDKMFTIAEVLEISRRTGAPVVFDNLHDILNPSDLPCSTSEIIALCARTWEEADGHQKLHYSQQDPVKKGGAHSATIDAGRFLRYHDALPDKNVDIMLEVKDKNRSAVKISICLFPRIQAVEQEWARYKYSVLEKSQEAYLKVRVLLKEKQAVEPVRFYTLVDDALSLPDSLGEQLNALQHVWGYFKKDATAGQKEKFRALASACADGSLPIGKAKTFLRRMMLMYGSSYLEGSYYFDW